MGLFDKLLGRNTKVDPNGVQAQEMGFTNLETSNSNPSGDNERNPTDAWVNTKYLKKSTGTTTPESNKPDNDES